MENTKEKLLKRVDAMESSAKEMRDLILDSETVVERFKSALGDVSKFLGITSEEPTAEEVKTKIEEKVDTATDAAVEKTVDEVIKATETKAEEVKSATASDEGKAATTKVKDAVVKDVKENVKEKKEAIKAEAKKVA